MAVIEILPLFRKTNYLSITGLTVISMTCLLWKLFWTGMLLSPFAKTKLEQLPCVLEEQHDDQMLSAWNSANAQTQIFACRHSVSIYYKTMYNLFEFIVIQSCLHTPIIVKVIFGSFSGMQTVWAYIFSPIIQVYLYLYASKSMIMHMGKKTLADWPFWTWDITLLFNYKISKRFLCEGVKIGLVFGNLFKLVKYSTLLICLLQVCGLWWMWEKTS